MPHDNELDWSLVVRYLADEATPAERAEVERWVAAQPGRDEELAAVRRLWSDAGHIPSQARIDGMWDELARRAHLTAQSGSAGARPSATAMPRETASTQPLRILSFPAAPRRPVPVWRVAAAALAASVVVAVSVAVLRDGPNDTPNAATVAPSSSRVFATARGQRSTLRLDDGTRVELGYASTIHVAPFSGRRRELWLEGEAVFDVVHEEKRPFIVHAANSVTEDLGTVFGIRAYRADSAVRVVVVSGLVSLRAAGSVSGGVMRDTGIVLRPGELGQLEADGRVQVSAADTMAHTSWLSGRIVTQNTRLDEIAADLARRFDVSISIPDSSLAAMRVTVKTPPTHTLNDALDLITIPLFVRYRRTEGGGGIVLER